MRKRAFVYALGKYIMKQLQFIQLAQDVSNCHLCANMITPPHFTCPEYLENDDHGLHTEMPYVNRWN